MDGHREPAVHGAAAPERNDGMPTMRIDFQDLPVGARAAVEALTGRIHSAASVTTGLNSSVAARLHTASGKVFCKALPATHRWVWTQQREADIAPHLYGVAPALVARLAVDGWDIVLFEALDGHTADFSPGSPDLLAVVTLLDAIAQTACPPVELRDIGERLRDYASTPADLDHFTGSALLHTDLNYANIIVDAGRARIVDWGWASRGAPWLDAAYWVVWLISAGHDPATAEQWAARTSTWSTASGAALLAFSETQAALWAEISHRDPGDAWSARLANASRCWMDHRRTT
ncbi:hypothetical protein AB0H83_23460 [Dactylosporangium sp. NPDC050688]|uniref:hypothetical protein n=1 Tax=Dactylosporangium sp. NPDC050688 TaxID=3157217 RepID=UPI00340F25D1